MFVLLFFFFFEKWLVSIIFEWLRKQKKRRCVSFLFWVEKTAGSFGVCVRPYNRTDRFNSSPYYALKTVLVIVNYTRVKTISVDSQKKKTLPSVL